MSSLKHPHRFRAHHTRGSLVSGSRSPEVKRWGREANYSTPYSAEVKNECSFTATPPYVFMVCTRKPLPISSTKHNCSLITETHIATAYQQF